MELVTLKTFDQYFSAHILSARLEDAGIQVYLLDEHTVTIDPILTNAIGGIKLAVAKEDEQAARELLGLYEEEARGRSHCPNCGGHQFLLLPARKPGNILLALFTWIFSGFAVAGKQLYRCQDCGFESELMPVDAKPAENN
ncbi:MAG TPA: hypothetical protein DCQ34_04335 [Chitinophagaceae bacterium]|nr:hypothetical protein [Chitinophagaceae bacterium]HCY89710.1 hypothetical protein [Chitinophagaceae bacterium]HRF27959.1 DUF2007 domain-containing protein [Ferruginibacter sp.]